MAQPPTNAEADAAVPAAGTPNRPLTNAFLKDVIGYFTTLAASIATKANAASAALTGVPTAPTATPGTNNTQLATTAYADAIALLKANINNAVFTGTLTAAQDAALALQVVTLQQLQAAMLQLGKRGRCRVGTTGNIVISTALNNADVLNGVTLATGDLVLVKDQTLGQENGVYVVGVTPVRSPEFDTWAEFPGAVIAVAEGTVGGDTVWLCTNNDGGTLNTTPIVFSPVNIAGALLAANNLSDVANAATARGNLGALASSGGTATNLTTAGPVTSAGVNITTPNVVALTANAGVLLTSAGLNTVSNNANTALTNSGSPSAQGWRFEIYRNTDSSARTWTVPSRFSIQRQAAITSMVLPANSIVMLSIYNDGTTDYCMGDPVPLASKGLQFNLATVTNADFTMFLYAPFDGDLEQYVTKAVSGTCTATVKVAGVSAGGTPNAVSTSQASQAITGAFVKGDRISVTFSANAACLGLESTLLLRPKAA